MRWLYFPSLIVTCVGIGLCIASEPSWSTGISAVLLTGYAAWTLWMMDKDGYTNPYDADTEGVDAEDHSKQLGRLEH